MSSNINKYNILLDLDNTLISAEALEEFPFTQKGIRKKAIQFAIHDMDGYYIVFERPGVQEFLDWLFENYNVSVWTAASKDYALFIIENIILTKPERQLDYIFFSYHCDISKKMYSASKRLKLLFEKFNLPGYNEHNTLIVDDLGEVYKCQPNNAIAIKAFEILEEGSEKDTELVTIRRLIETKFPKS